MRDSEAFHALLFLHGRRNRRPRREMRETVRLTMSNSANQPRPDKDADDDIFPISGLTLRRLNVAARR